MRSTAAPQNDLPPVPEAPGPKREADETYAWPPPDDVLQGMAVIDFETGETRPVRLEPPPELAGRVSDVLDATADSTGPVRVGPHAGGRVGAQTGVGAAAKTAPRTATPWFRQIWFIVAVVVIAIAAGGFGAWRFRGLIVQNPQPAAPTVTAQPAATPSVSPPPTSSAEPIPSNKPASPETQPTGGAAASVAVRTDTAGVRVWIDGVLRGRTPLDGAEVQPGSHNVAVEGPAGRITQTIRVSAGSSATVFVTTGGSVSGGISVSAPSELEVRESGRVVGTSRAERILLEPGRHTLDLVNETLGYESRQVVDVVPGKFQPIAVQFPDGSLNLNALPWAEVFVDGQRVGETPIGNLKIRVGSHQVTFRHPDLGEITRTVDVTLRGPARLSVNLERKEP